MIDGATWAVAFQYPWDAGKPFNLDHFLKVHLPLGVGLTEKHLGIRPLGILVHVNEPVGGEPPAFAAVSNVYFATEADARRFLTLFEVEEAARLLIADFPNYTAGPPRVALSSLTPFQASAHSSRRV